MSLKYLVSKEYIPEDGSVEIIQKFENNTNAEVLVFPDVHMKKGAMIANGMLISSDNNIFLSCLGVENCGYTFGKINGSTESELVTSFANFSSILNKRIDIPRYDRNRIQDLFDSYLAKDYEKKNFLYKYLGFDNYESLRDYSHLILNNRLLKLASKSLCSLGGGNHFFEIHKITEVYDTDIINPGDFIFMLHSDSIAVGDNIYELYSDLHEMKSTGSIREKIRIFKFKMIQQMYFHDLCRKIEGLKDDLNIILNPSSEYQSIDIRTELGKNLMIAHNLSALFGEMNREAIISTWAETQNIKINILGSHSHDSIMAEEHNGQIKIVHRNGVQYIGQDKYCILPSAMGNFSFLMKNMFNEDAYFSTNHGTGRMDDKHIARNKYTEENTTKEIWEKNVALFRVGNGNLAEQNMHAFKEPLSIVNEMERNNLAVKVAKTYPIAIIKG